MKSTKKVRISKRKRLAQFLFVPLVFLLIRCNENKYMTDPADANSVSVTSMLIDTSILVIAPPEELQLDSFYAKYLDASGIPVVSSAKVPDEALFAVQKMINKMISFRPDVLANMIKNKIRVGIMAKTEVTTDLPECRDWNERFPEEDWNTRGRGYGATLSIPLTSCAEENLLCYGEGVDKYYNEDIFIHEFAHSIHGLGILFVDKNFDTELQAALDSAKANGLWENTYAASNSSEYFAEGVQDWFNINAEAIPANGIHNEINTHDELKTYDPVLYNIIKRYFAKNDLKISCHQ